MVCGQEQGSRYAGCQRCSTVVLLFGHFDGMDCVRPSCHCRVYCGVDQFLLSAQRQVKFIFLGEVQPQDGIQTVQHALDVTHHRRLDSNV